jgi:uncharacterized protein with NAD-binding domain and iron-sulfur cluster
MSDTIAIVGGGVAGLCTAHHLSRAGVKGITVYEASDAVGGKARSQYPTDANGAVYPGEHGFRFFPHFYRHLLETLRQIPAGRGTVRDRLVGPKVGAIAYKGRKLIEVARPVEIKPSLLFVKTTVGILMRPEVSLAEATRFAGRLLQFASSCEERREHEYDAISWSKFTGADDMPYSREFEDVVIRASQNLSAMRAAESSAATIGAITLQLLFTAAPDEHADALLCSPTDEAWLADWRSHLESQGVVFEMGARLQAIDFDPLAGRIERLRFAGRANPVTADTYVLAIPLEKLVEVLSAPMMDFDPALARLPALAREACGHMTGLQFFLKNPAPIAPGHVHYPGTPFALTSISQGQFWTPPPDRRNGIAPALRDVLSVIISDWDAPGTEGKPGRAYTSRDELAREVWRQMKRALPPGMLRDEDILMTHVDTHVKLAPFANETPLLIHPRGQRSRRPDAETAISNLLLASDFVRTYTDLATMEGADEAARRATRAILDRRGILKSRWPDVRPLDEGKIFNAAKELDRILFDNKLPHLMTPTDPGFFFRYAPEAVKRWLPSFLRPTRKGLGPFSDDVFQSVGKPLGDRLRTIQERPGTLPILERKDVTPVDLETWENFLRQS